MTTESKAKKAPAPKAAVPKEVKPAKVTVKPEAVEEKLRKELVELAKKPAQKELVEKLKQLVIKNEVNEIALFEFLNRIWSSNKENIVSASSINILAVQLSLSKEINPDLKKILLPKLYKLSADRGDGSGAKNYARVLFYSRYGVGKNIEQALKYANIAIKKSIAACFVRAEIFREKGMHVEAMQDYLKVPKSEKTDWDKAKSIVNEAADTLCARLSGVESIVILAIGKCDLNLYKSLSLFLYQAISPDNFSNHWRSAL